MKNRTRNLASSQKLSKFENEHTLEKEVIKEIQVINTSWISSSNLNNVRGKNYTGKWRNRSKIVDIQTSKIQNFEQKLGKIRKIKPKWIQNTSSSSNFTISWSGKIENPSRSRSRKRVTCNNFNKYDTSLRSRAKKNSRNSNISNSSNGNRNVKISKPSSVTTLFTATSADGSLVQTSIIEKDIDTVIF